MRKISNEELNRPDLETFKYQEKHPIILVLDNLRSMHNVGSAFRTADAFAVEAVYLCGITAQPPHREIHKTALGATDSVVWKYFETTQNACEEARKAGYKIIAVEQADKSTYLENFQPKAEEKLALVFGNEVFGVEEEIVMTADICLEIPQFGTKHSINVSISMGIVLWDILSKTKFSN